MQWTKNNYRLFVLHATWVVSYMYISRESQVIKTMEEGNKIAMFPDGNNSLIPNKGLHMARGSREKGFGF